MLIRESTREPSGGCGKSGDQRRAVHAALAAALPGAGLSYTCQSGCSAPAALQPGPERPPLREKAPRLPGLPTPRICTLCDDASGNRVAQGEFSGRCPVSAWKADDTPGLGPWALGTEPGLLPGPKVHRARGGSAIPVVGQRLRKPGKGLLNNNKYSALYLFFFFAVRSPNAQTLQKVN